MSHDPDNDRCASSPFEGCICHLSVAEQIELTNRAALAALANPVRITLAGHLEEDDDELEVLDD